MGSFEETQITVITTASTKFGLDVNAITNPNKMERTDPKIAIK